VGVVLCSIPAWAAVGAEGEGVPPPTHIFSAYCPGGLSRQKGLSVWS